MGQQRSIVIGVFAIAFMGISACGPSMQSSNLGGPEKKVRLVALSDLHGALEARETKTKDGKVVETGGAALLTSYINRIRETSPHPVVVLDGGDMFQGTLVSNTAEGEPVIKFYNHLKLDAAAVGNHEFDYGPIGGATIPKTPTDDPRGALKERAKQAQFPFLACNIRYKDGSYPEWLKPSILLQKGNVKVGVVGATTESTPSTTNAKNLVGLDVFPAGKYVVEEAKKLRAQGADFVFLTIHAGSGCKDNSVKAQNDLSSCDLKGEIFDILNNAPRGLINAVVSGHTHMGIAKNFKGTAVLQSYSHGQSALFADVSNKGKHAISEISNVCGNFVKENNQLTCFRDPVTKFEGDLVDATYLGATMKKDAEVVALLEKDFARVAEIKKQPIGVSTLSYFERSYYDESALGNLVVDLMKGFVEVFGLSGGGGGSELSDSRATGLSFYEAPAHAKEFKEEEDPPRAIIGMTNNGGLRANIEVGALTYGQVFDVLPFDNQLALLKVNGEIVSKLMGFGIDRKHGGLSWSGVKMEADACKVTQSTINDEAVDPAATYWVVTNDYLATGGSGVDELKLTSEQVVILDGAPFLRDAIVDVLKKDMKDLDPQNYFTKETARVKVKTICGGEE